MTGGYDIRSEVSLRWTSLDLNGDKSTLVQVMAWCRQATSHYLNQCWLRCLPPYGVTRPQWVQSFWLSDNTWRYRSGSTLAQVMACCLTAPSHYLNECWLIINRYLWHSPETSFTGGAHDMKLQNEFEKNTCYITTKSLRAKDVNF